MTNKNGQPKTRGKSKRPSQNSILQDSSATLTRTRALKILKHASDAIKEAMKVLDAATFQETLAAPNFICGIDFYGEVRRFEEVLIVQALDYSHGHQGRAASLLGLRATTLNEKLKLYEIGPKRNRRRAGTRSGHQPKNVPDLPPEEATLSKRAAIM